MYITLQSTMPMHPVTSGLEMTSRICRSAYTAMLRSQQKYDDDDDKTFLVNYVPILLPCSHISVEG